MATELAKTPATPPAGDPPTPAAPAAPPASAAPPAGAEGDPSGEVKLPAAPEGDPASAPKEPAKAAEPAPKAAKRGHERDWRDDRIATLTARLKAKEEAEPTKPATSPAPAAAPALDPNAEFERLVQAEAAKRVSQNSFAAQCNAEFERGKAKWADFSERMRDLQSVVDQSDQASVDAYYALLQAGIETGDLHTVVYELGSDLNEAAKMLKLSPLKMGVELTKKAIAGARIDDVSRLPKPVTPVAGGRGEQIPIDPTNADLADQLTTAEWMKRRNEQLANRRQQ